MDTPIPFRKDRSLMAAMAVGLVLRLLPLAFFIQGNCVRDECIYRSVATGILNGEGLGTTAKGWLPAPGFPYTIAAMKAVFGAFWAVKFVHVGLGVLSVYLIYRITEHLFDNRTARLSAWMFALHPTLVYFTGTMWIETFYIFFLLLAVLGVLRIPFVGLRGAVSSGISLGLATLYRGVATYLPPIFAVAAMWPDEGFTTPGALLRSFQARWKRGAAIVLAWAVVVAPYSIHGSQKYGGFMITDATMGHVLFLGNNDFPPLTFDYGNGMLTGPLYADYLRTGRRPCDRNELPVISSKCEVETAVQWIQDNPSEFIDRIPMRVAQLVNPNSFFTRHIRWGYWEGIPWWFKEFLAISVVLSSSLVMVGGTVAAFARGRGAYAIMASGTVLYTVATTCLMYGMTRFRLPLEPLWMVFLASLLADPRACVSVLKQSGPRLAGVLLTLPPLLVLMSWYVRTGFPMFW